MPVKRRIKRKARKVSVKTRRSNGGLDQLAKAKMPKWHVVQSFASDSQAKPESDAVSPKLSGLYAKRASVTTSSKRSSLRSSNFANASRSSGKSGLVVMAPDSPEDSKAGAKTQVFEDDEHTGAQG